jgi:hypothetical protein
VLDNLLPPLHRRPHFKRYAFNSLCLLTRFIQILQGQWIEIEESPVADIMKSRVLPSFDDRFHFLDHVEGVHPKERDNPGDSPRIFRGIAYHRNCARPEAVILWLLESGKLHIETMLVDSFADLGFGKFPVLKLLGSSAKDPARVADAAEAKKVADAAEAKKVADAAEAKKVADAAEAKKVADAAEAKKVADASACKN